MKSHESPPVATSCPPTATHAPVEPCQGPEPLRVEPAEKMNVSVNRKPKPIPRSKSIATLESEIAATEAQLAATLSRLSEARLKKADRHTSSSTLTPTPSSSTTTTGTGTPPKPTGEENAIDGADASRSLDDGSQQQELLAHAQGIFDGHIALLKRYNLTKDIAMGMLSLIADRQGKLLAEVMLERGVGEDD